MLPSFVVLIKTLPSRVAHLRSYRKYFKTPTLHFCLYTGILGAMMLRIKVVVFQDFLRKYCTVTAMDGVPP
jgi:hypothetical protein